MSDITHTRPREVEGIVIEGMLGLVVDGLLLPLRPEYAPCCIPPSGR